jgi:2-dehydro-3-deoxyphosphogluconate aldolase / (4S)-4-hydroxy-2-oxoglutarate aldolase
MNASLERIATDRLIAIIRLENYDHAVEVAQALVAGGITIIEFTLTGRGALDAVTETRSALADKAVIGIGTALKAGDADDAALAGAQFVVTPIVRYPVIDAAHHHDLPIICGALTPTEMMNADDAGADMIKVFPARQFGPSYLRDVLAPLPHLRLVPTGGVSTQNAKEYFHAGATAVGIGGNLVAQQAVAAGDWAQITAQAQQCLAAISQ